ncbi:CapA family protein [Streptomyces olivoverticillatus]
MPRPAGFSWPWGEVLALLDGAAPGARVLNLETSVTRCGDFSPGKAIHYRMNPPNVPCLSAARPDVCVLANNHVLDFGPRGLEETLDTLADAGLRTAGAGRDEQEARRPAVVPVGAGGRVLVFSFGMPSSGIPRGWAATDVRPGVDLVAEATDAAAAAVAGRVRRAKQQGGRSRRFGPLGGRTGATTSPATRSVSRTPWSTAASTSSTGTPRTTPRPIEVYRGKLVLYGCGDFIDDYEGITGYEQYRDDLRLAYFASADPDTGALTDLRMAPLQARRLRLERAAHQDAEWLGRVLGRIGGRFGTRCDTGPDGELVLRWA